MKDEIQDLGKRLLVNFDTMKKLIFILCIIGNLAASGQSVGTEKNNTEQEVYKGAPLANGTDVPQRSSTVVSVSKLSQKPSVNATIYIPQHRSHIGRPARIAGVSMVGVSAAVLGINYDGNGRPKKSKLSAGQVNTWDFVALGGLLLTGLGVSIDAITHSGWFANSFTVVRGSNQVGIAFCIK